MPPTKVERERNVVWSRGTFETRTHGQMLSPLHKRPCARPDKCKAAKRALAVPADSCPRSSSPLPQSSAASAGARPCSSEGGRTCGEANGAPSHSSSSPSSSSSSSSSASSSSISSSSAAFLPFLPLPFGVAAALRFFPLPFSFSFSFSALSSLRRIAFATSSAWILKSRAVVRFMKRSKSRSDVLESLTTVASNFSRAKTRAGTSLASRTTRAAVSSDEVEKERRPYMASVTPVSPQTCESSASSRFDAPFLPLSTAITPLNTASNCLKRAVHSFSRPCAGLPSI
mmetsp:Transcript_46101/g.152864  ORF Transcript_46101/g.152864 Transcript_46101/m.152864 type:complete len:286 (+) Transcript_46101:121-978(+)